MRTFHVSGVGAISPAVRETHADTAGHGGGGGVDTAGHGGGGGVDTAGHGGGGGVDTAGHGGGGGVDTAGHGGGGGVDTAGHGGGGGVDTAGHGHRRLKLRLTSCVSLEAQWDLIKALGNILLFFTYPKFTVFIVCIGNQHVHYINVLKYVLMYPYIKNHS